MADFIDEIMGFNPQDLSAFNEPVQTNYDENIYKTNPIKFSKAEDGHYRSVIKIIYNPFDVKQSIVPQATYAMYDSQGFFMVRSKLAMGDKSCPLFTSWKKLWFSNDDKKKEWAKTMYDKVESQWCLVQILEDANQPELVGKIKVMKLPKVVYTKMANKMNPSAESKKLPIPIMDYLIGTPLEMDVAPGPDDPQNPSRKQREISYDLCEFSSDYAPIIQTDGKPLFTDEELDTIDQYNTAKADVLKAKSKAKVDAAKAELQKLNEPIKALYKKSLDYLKANAVNLVDECGYKEWDEATTARVQNWIDVVAELKDPKTVVSGVAPKVEFTEQSSTDEVGVGDPFSEAVGSTDGDLPF